MKKKISSQKGFSLVELLVAVTIFFIITGAVLFKQSKFSSDILITNTAYEVALAVREAQVFGIGSKQSEFSSNPVDRRKSYGIVFSTLSPSSFFMFSENVNADGKTYDSSYDPLQNPAKYQIIDTINFRQDQKIKDFCGVINPGSSEVLKCAGSSSNHIKYMNVGFVKPNLNAVIKVSYTNTSTVDTFTEAKIFVVSTLGDKCRTIVVNGVGQISIEPTTSANNGCPSTSIIP